MKWCSSLSVKASRDTKSLLSKRHPQPCKPRTHRCDMHAVFFPNSVQPHDLLLAFPAPATAPRAAYTTRGYGKDKHMRNITELPTHLTAGGQTSFPNALACAGAACAVSASPSFQRLQFVQGQLRKMSIFLSKFPVTGLKF